MRKWLLILAIGLAGCSTGEDDGKKDAGIPHVNIEYPSPPDTIIIEEVRAENKVGAMHNYMNVAWRKINGAIGYKLYSSVSFDTGYSVVTAGSPQDNARVGVYFDEEGVRFFKVSPLNNEGVEGEISKAFSFYYSGY